MTQALAIPVHLTSKGQLLLTQVLPLDVHLAPGQLCGCHHAPLADPGPGGLAGQVLLLVQALFTAGIATDSPVASLCKCVYSHLLMRHLSSLAGVCSVSGSALQRQDVVPDPRAVELGHSTRLAFPPGAAMPPLRVPQPGSADATAAAFGAMTLRSVHQVKVSCYCVRGGVCLAHVCAQLKTVWIHERVQAASCCTHHGAARLQSPFEPACLLIILTLPSDKRIQSVSAAVLTLSAAAGAARTPRVVRRLPLTFTSLCFSNFSRRRKYLKFLVQLEELSEGLMWGRPHLLAADGDALADYEAGEANDQAVAALCQVNLNVHIASASCPHLHCRWWKCPGRLRTA